MAPPPESLRPRGQEWSTLPEVHYTRQEGTNLPESVPVSNLPEAVPVSDMVDPRTRYYSHQAELAAKATSEETPRSTVGWLRRGKNKVILGVSIVVVLAIVAVVVGVVVSQRQVGDNTSNGTDGGDKGKPDNQTSTTIASFGTPTSFPALGSNDPPPVSSCEGTVCPQMLASARVTATNTLLLARGSNGEIWSREIVTGSNSSSPSSFSPSWKTDEWKSLGGGKFSSQPTVVSPRDGRVDVFAVSAEDESPRYKTLQNGVWETEWTSLGGVAKSPPVVCSIAQDNIIVVVVGGDGGLWRKSTDDGGNFWAPTGQREGPWASDGGAVGGSLGTVCVEGAGSDGGGGLLQYFVEAGCGPGPDMGLRFRMWNNTEMWYSNVTEWVSQGEVSCRGNPTMVSRGGGKTISYFVVGTDMAVWTFDTSVETGDAAGAVSLGGDFQSAVEVLVTGESRLDVLAVGVDTRLKHKAYVEGQGWGEAWEDLGGYFNSAPKVVRLNDTAVAVFGIGPEGNVIHSVFGTGSGGAAWGLQQWYSDRGEMSSLSY